MNFSLAKIAQICSGELLNVSNPENLIISNIATDSRVDLSETMFVALVGEKFDAHNFLQVAIEQNAKVLCVKKDTDSTNFTLPILKVDDTTKAYQDIANAYRNSFDDLLVIGITGSVGKTSCKEIIRQVCIEKYGEDNVLSTIGNTNNHIGVPQNLFRLKPNHKVAVIEMGTSGFGEIEVLSRCAEPNIAIINSIAPCHLENLKNLQGVASEKSDIFKHVKAGGLALFPTDIPEEEIISNNAKKQNLTIKCYGNFMCETVSESIEKSSFYLIDEDKNHLLVNWNLTGKHQMINATSTAIIGKFLGLTLEEIGTALSKVKLIGMRMKTTKINGVTYINDAYNCNTTSMLATLSTVKSCLANERVILLLGDMLELGEVAISEHEKVLKYALDNFPNSPIVAVGPLMKLGAENLEEKSRIIFAENSKSAYPIVETLLTDGSYLFLKASRGTRLEEAIREEAR